MGLNISYEFSITATVEQARAIVTALRDLALDLSFAQVDEWVELQGEACHFDMEDLDDPYVFLKLRGIKPVEIAMNGMSWRSSTYLIAFDTLPGQGSETAAFGLATHSEIGETNDWIWTGFCKTQYASNPQYGGQENFLRCHLAIVKILDEAQKLGVCCEVDDEGNYWKTRNIATLMAALSAENIFMATTMGAIKDTIDPSSATLEAPILAYPNFEQLEAEGNQDLDRNL
ncbi:hypothetical protein [Leptolyngbya sp. NIES-2104]|uniref:hypothetical protein n=1 Tax=Leptolyngbya sp. NIES-2104 TaxID=1552121 RepID=UPI0006ECAB74|nr:hypothetical protein [Leptolyngbya sp. NIES-2104]GAP99658.1 hypothetical protein NIES2104_62240 [Leptolyngbya sp. NIES-2104]